MYVVTLWGALTVAFFFFRLIPATRSTLIQTLQQNYVYNQQASAEVIARYQQMFGLDGNIFTQYLTVHEQPDPARGIWTVADQLPDAGAERDPGRCPGQSVCSGISVACWSGCSGSSSGALAAGGAARPSAIITNVSIALSHVPFFFVALILVYVFAYTLGCFPRGPRTTRTSDRDSTGTSSRSVLKYGLLPALSIVDHRRRSAGSCRRGC